MNQAAFFSYVQNAPWYTHFLDPVLDALAGLPPNAAVLDLGTGPGRLIEMGRDATSFHWTGADIDDEMVAAASRRLRGQEVPLHLVPANGVLPFPPNAFDAVTMCSLLHLLPTPFPTLEESWRVLRPGGRVVSLTPTGAPASMGALLRQAGWRPRNWTFLLWRRMTARGGRAWTRGRVLEQFATAREAGYRRRPVFHGWAAVEVVSRQLER